MSTLLTSESQGPRDGRAVDGKRARSRAPAVEHLSVEDRAARGKAARADVGRERSRRMGARDGPAGSRRAAGGTGGDAPASSWCPIRYGRMLVSPFTFYRGAAAVMAADLANEPRTGLDVQLCGDAHLSNFGVFAAPDRRMVFSINDFDETLPGPFEWDVKRLVASFAVAGRDRGFDDKQRHAINLAVSARVPRRDGGLRRHAHDGALVHPARHRRHRRALGVSGKGKQRKRFEHNVAKARAKDSLRALGKLTHAGRRRAADRKRPAAHRADRGHGGARGARSGRSVHARDHPLVSPNPVGRSPQPARALPLRPCGAQGRRGRQRRDARVDHPAARPRRRGPAAAAGQGGGGVGARAGARRQRVRQPRPARRRGPAPDAGRERHHARLAEPRGSGRRQARLLHPPALGCQGLGARRGDGAARHDGSTPTSAAGRSLAAHARSGDAIAIASYLGRGDAFDRALATFAEAYAEQNERDYDALAGAAASGRIAVETGL